MLSVTQISSQTRAVLARRTGVEITSPSTASHDYIHKLHMYADAGVREYWIVNPLTQTNFVYFFGNSDLDVKTYTFQDRIKVNIYDDFWIDFKDIIS